MRRNKELAKEILEVVLTEDNGGGGLYREEIVGVFLERYPDKSEAGLSDSLAYHLHLLETAGFLKITRDDARANQDNFELTWAGHDFLEAI